MALSAIPTCLRPDLAIVDDVIPGLRGAVIVLRALACLGDTSMRDALLLVSAHHEHWLEILTQWQHQQEL